MTTEKPVKKRINISSAKQKGRRLQQWARDLFMGILPLLPGDIISTSMGVSGPDLGRSPLARKHLPFKVSCKNCEHRSIWFCWKDCLQIKSDLPEDIPLLIMARNHQEPLAVLRATDFARIWEEIDKTRFSRESI